MSHAASEAPVTPVVPGLPSESCFSLSKTVTTLTVLLNIPGAGAGGTILMFVLGVLFDFLLCPHLLFPASCVPLHLALEDRVVSWLFGMYPCYRKSRSYICSTAGGPLVPQLFFLDAGVKSHGRRHTERWGKKRDEQSPKAGVELDGDRWGTIQDKIFPFSQESVLANDSQAERKPPLFVSLMPYGVRGCVPCVDWLRTPMDQLGHMDHHHNAGAFQLLVWLQ